MLKVLILLLPCLLLQVSLNHCLDPSPLEFRSSHSNSLKLSSFSHQIILFHAAIIFHQQSCMGKRLCYGCIGSTGICVVYTVQDGIECTVCIQILQDILFVDAP